jgi:glutamate-1-semialdehyde 2,1-aminomutase
VAGRADIMNLAGSEGDHRVKFSGGTYSAHPASMLAAKTLMTYLVDHEEEIYPRLAALGEKTRQTIEGAFAEEGIYARCTGNGNDALPGSSLFMCHFPYNEDTQLNRPKDVFDPSVCDVTLAKEALQLALLLEDVYAIHGHGAASAAHTEADIELLGQTCCKVARRFRPYL